MRIVWINESADFVGGAEHYVRQTAAMLEGMGFESTLLHRAGTWVEPRFIEPFRASFPVVDLRTQLHDIRPDLIFLHQFHDRALWSTLSETAAQLGVPVVQFIHDHRLFCLRRHKYTAVGEQTCTRVTSRLACYPCLGFVERDRTGAKVPLRLRTYSTLDREQSLARGFDAHVVGSSYMREHVRAHAFDATRVHHIPLGVRPPVSDPAATTQVRSDPRTLLFVGALLKGKGLDLLLEAMVRLPRDVRLKVVGEGAQAQDYREQVDALELGARVEFLGRLERGALSALYRNVAAVVVPSRTPETFGFVGPEALLHGTPVVASAVGGTSDWLRNGETGLAFASGDVDALRAAIERTLANPKEAASFAEAGRALCSENFDQRRHVQRLASLFTELRGSMARAS